MNILFLTTILPIKGKSGGEIVSKLFIDNLKSLGYNVDVLGYIRKNDRYAEIPKYMHLVKKIVIESNSSKLFTLINLVKSFITGYCYSSQKYITKEYIRVLKNHIETKDYQLIIIDHFQMGWILKHLPSNITIASIAHNVESDLYEQLSNNKQTNAVLRKIYNREAHKMRYLEKLLINKSKYIWLLTNDNKNRYCEMFGCEQKYKVACIPPDEVSNINLSENSKKWDIGIIGTWTWKANSDGLWWFFEEVYPLIPPNISICVAGIGAEWLLEKYDNVSYLGFVDCANSFMKNSRVIAIPSIAGDGIQIKSIQAISIGTPIVATSFALRGIDNLPSFVEEANTANEFKEYLLDKISSYDQHITEALNWTSKRKQQFIDSVTIN